MKDYKKNSFPGLEKSIIDKIYKIEKRNLLIKQALYVSLSIVSFIGIVYSGAYTLSVLSSSGVYEYISLIFSDIQSLSYLKEISLSIAETVPFLGLSLVLAASGIFLWSILKSTKIQLFRTALI